MRSLFVFLLVSALLSGVSLPGQDTAAEKRYPVEHFNLVYAHANPRLPAIEQLNTLPVLAGTLPAGNTVSESELRTIFAAVVARLNQLGIYGVFVLPARDEIDPQSKNDLRATGNRSLTLVVWASEIAQVRTLARGSRFPAGAAAQNPAHARILANSPLKAPQNGQPGSLFEKALLDDYLLRLNRHPDRGVEAALSPADEPGMVVLDYLVNESRPWFVYAQVSNTGTKATDEMRERVGAVHNQLFNRDDVLSIDYITSDFTKANAVFASYDYPLIFPDRLKIKSYGSWGDFDATTPYSSIQNARFTGSSWNGGGELNANLFRFCGVSIGASAGAAWQHSIVNNKLLSQTGEADLLTPYATVTIDRQSDILSLSGSFGFETNVNSISPNEQVLLGRLDTTDKYDLVKGALDLSVYAEPVLFGVSSRNTWQKSTLAHEFALSVKANYVTGGDRVIPQKEQAIGGYFFVRGYPESVVSGDSAYTASAEYRFHVPRALRPRSVKEGGSGPQPRTEEPATTLFGRPFNYRPERVYARPDWDFIVRAFLDAGYTEDNRGTQPTRRPEDGNHTLMSTGLGLELQVLRNVNVRVDWGYALRSVHTGIYNTRQAGDPQAGDSRLHFLATFLW
jgi:hemolysin activation/secretion protein